MEEEDYKHWHEHHQEKREMTRKYFSKVQVSEIFHSLYDNPQQDEYVANEFLNIIKQYPISKVSLISVAVTRIRSTNILCIDPEYKDESGEVYSTTMIIMDTNVIDVLANGYTMEAHIQVLDFLNSLPRQIKIMNVLQ